MPKGLALYWRRIPQRYNLIGTECRNCGEKFFPPRALCPKCRRRSDIHEFKFSGSGEVYAHTVIHAPPDGFEFQVPYVVAIIKLDEGPLVTAQIIDKAEKVKVGKKVEPVFRRIVEMGDTGIIQYGYKFRIL